MAKKPTDGELIQLSLEDPDLFAEIFDAHYAAIYRFVSAALGRLRAEDIAGEVFVRAFESRHRFDPSYESARPWLYGIASNLIQDHLRKTARQHRAYQRAATGEEAQSGFENEVASRVDAARSIPGLMDALMALRSEYRDAFEKKHSVRLGFLSFFVKAAIVALKEIPAVNAEIYGDEVIYKNYYDVGVAVGTPQGLVVPVVRDADKMSFAEIENAVAEYGRRARDGKLTIAEMTGGTFTISNGGVYGSLMSMPILNPPQSGILGMHTIQKRPIAVDGKVEIGSMMYLALSYDHRIVDGREAVTFLVRMKEVLEDPQRLLIDV